MGLNNNSYLGCVCVFRGEVLKCPTCWVLKLRQNQFQWRTGAAFSRPRSIFFVSELFYCHFRWRLEIRDKGKPEYLKGGWQHLPPPSSYTGTAYDLHSLHYPRHEYFSVYVTCKQAPAGAGVPLHVLTLTLPLGTTFFISFNQHSTFLHFFPPVHFHSIHMARNLWGSEKLDFSWG